jgi:hypothetical protein
MTWLLLFWPWVRALLLIWGEQEEEKEWGTEEEEINGWLLMSQKKGELLYDEMDFGFN